MPQQRGALLFFVYVPLTLGLARQKPYSSSSSSGASSSSGTASSTSKVRPAKKRQLTDPLYMFLTSMQQTRCFSQKRKAETPTTSPEERGRQEAGSGQVQSDEGASLGGGGGGGLRGGGFWLCVCGGGTVYNKNQIDYDSPLSLNPLIGVCFNGAARPI